MIYHKVTRAGGRAIGRGDRDRSRGCIGRNFDRQLGPGGSNYLGVRLATAR